MKKRRFPMGWIAVMLFVESGQILGAEGKVFEVSILGYTVPYSLVEATCTSTEGAGLGSFTVDFVYVGDGGLVGRSFSCANGSDLITGGFEVPPFRVGGRSIWALKHRANGEVVAWAWYVFGRGWPVAEGWPDYEAAHYHAIAVQKLVNIASEPERITKLLNYALHGPPQLSEWATSILYEHGGETREALLHDGGPMEGLPLRAFFWLDEKLVRDGCELWALSDERLKRFAALANSELSESEAEGLQLRLNQISQGDQGISETRLVELERMLMANKSCPNKIRAWCLGTLGRMVGHNNNADAVDALLDHLASGRDTAWVAALELTRSNGLSNTQKERIRNLRRRIDDPRTLKYIDKALAAKDGD